MRSLDFGPGDAGKRYILCYQALCFADARCDRNELGAHGTLLTKLEGIGVVANPLRGEGDTVLYKCPSGGEVTISESEYTILKRYLNKFIEKCVGALSRELNGALQWLDNVPERAEPAKAAPAAEPSAP